MRPPGGGVRPTRVDTFVGLVLVLLRYTDRTTGPGEVEVPSGASRGSVDQYNRRRRKQRDLNCSNGALLRQGAEDLGHMAVNEPFAKLFHEGDGDDHQRTGQKKRCPRFAGQRGVAARTIRWSRTGGPIRRRIRARAYILFIGRPTRTAELVRTTRRWFVEGVARFTFARLVAAVGGRERRAGQGSAARPAGHRHQRDFGEGEASSAQGALVASEKVTKRHMGAGGLRSNNRVAR